MLSPLDALSLAGTIIQFVDFGSKVLSQSRQLYESQTGALSVNQELELVTSDLFALSQKLPNLESDGHETQDEKALRKLALVCSEISLELSTKLNGLKVSAKHKKWHSFRQAIKSVWSENERKQLVQRLSTCRDSMQMHVVVDLKNQMNAMALNQWSRFDNLDKTTQDIVTALLVKQDTVSMAVQDQTIALTQLLGRVELLAENQKLTTDAVKNMNRMSQARGVAFEAEASLGNQIPRYFEENEVKRRLAVAEAIVASLWFPSMMDREEAIDEAHEKTFNWIFDHKSESLPWDSFVEWLHHGSGIYWVNGKAASGKSTLMRYIYNHPKTMDYLEEWASPLALTTYRFYFWNSGTFEQRSQNGLIRAILSEAIKRNPHLAPIIFPFRWAEAYLVEPFNFHGAMRDVNTAKSQSWSLRELMEAFNNLITQRIVETKICLFIDGLDEYEGDHGSIVDVFKNVSKDSSVKMCLSSRPLLVFDDAFASAPSLRLQDLTHDDISRYVTSSFYGNIHFQRLAEDEPEGAPELVETIVSRADGVFLWVKLVVRDLLKGLSNRDDLIDLQRRLDLLPIDLEELFKSMLSKIDSFYLDKAAEIFLVARATHAIAEKGASSHARESKPITVQPLDIMTLSLAIDPDQKFLTRFKTGYTTERDETRRAQKINDQLKVRCAGLLETGKGITLSSKQTVQYLHRTVRDYLDRPDVLQTFIERTTRTGFQPNTAALRACIMRLENELLTPTTLKAFEETALLYAHEADTIHRAANTELVDLLHATLLRLTTRWPNLDPQGAHHAVSRFQNGFLPVAIKWDLCSYVKEKLSRPSVKAREIKEPLLTYATGDHSDSGPRLRPSPRMVAMLITHGFSPNQKFKGISPFQFMIKKILGEQLQKGFVEYPPEVKIELSNYLRIIETMLEHGANASACLRIDGEYRTATRLVTEKLELCCPSEAPRTQAMFEKHGGKKELSIYQRWISAD